MADNGDSTSTEGETTQTNTSTSEPEKVTQVDDSELNKWKSMSRKTEADNKKLAKELADLKTKNQTEQEKAIEQARNEGLELGKNELKNLFGSKLVAAEFKVAAAGRMESKAIDALVSGLNVSNFLTEDGEVDTSAITKLVDTVAPKPSDKKTADTNRLDLGQGTRNPSAGNGSLGIGDDDGILNALNSMFNPQS